MNYSVKEIDNVYCVYEKPTEQIIREYYDKQEAKRFIRHLNFGGGFDGNTPTFFLKNFEKSKQNN